jgi:nicotinamidase-related amidase
MPLTELDNTAALIVIDLQKGVAGLPAVHPLSDIVDRTAQLARAFREKGLPVVLVNVTGPAPGRTDAGKPKYSFPPDWHEFLPALEQHPEDYIVSKQRWGAFLGTSLEVYLRARGVTQVFLTGVATSAGVESTARSAYDLGYHVVLVVDAMTDLSPVAHAHSVEKIFPRIGETETAARVLEILQERQPA